MGECFKGRAERLDFHDQKPVHGGKGSRGECGSGGGGKCVRLPRAATSKPSQFHRLRKKVEGEGKEKFGGEEGMDGLLFIKRCR